MKKAIIFLLFLAPLILFGQDYKLLTATSKKLYSTVSQPQTAYSMSIESAKMSETDSVYYNFFELDNELTESDTCFFWGEGPFCYKQNRPGWLGPRIEFDNQFSYRFFNLNNDTLHFSFNTEVDGPIPFYSDSIQEFSILYEKDDTLTLLGVADSARYFKILHADLDGNLIDSPLNGYELIISKQFGLENFFEVDSFPSVLKPVKLIGNVSPNAGLYLMTNETVYNFEVGDEVQYMEYSWYESPMPPEFYYTRYRKFIFLEKEITDDLLIYKVRQELFYKDSVGIEIKTLNKDYLRSDTIAKIPFEKFNILNRSLKEVDYCGKFFWTYSIDGYEGEWFCGADTCWGTGDTFGPPDKLHTSYVFGLGLYSDSRKDPYPDGYDLHDEIIYFKKDGTECGTEVVVTVNENKALKDNITVSPNPVRDEATISSPIIINEIDVISSSGKKLFSKILSGKQNKINMTGFENDVYFLRLKLITGQVIIKKIIVLQ